MQNVDGQIYNYEKLLIDVYMKLQNKKICNCISHSWNIECCWKLLFKEFKKSKNKDKHKDKIIWIFNEIKISIRITFTLGEINSKNILS